MKYLYPARQLRFLYLTISIILFTVFTANAQNRPDGGIEQKILGTPITGTVDGTYIDGLQSYTSVKFNDGATSIANYTRGNAVSEKIKNVISLNINENVFIPDNFIVTAKVKIEYGSSETNFTTIPEQILTVNYSKESGAKYSAKNYFSFDNAPYVKITLSSSPISPESIGSFNPRSVLVLLNEMQAIRYYTLDNSVLPSFATPEAPLADEVKFNWNCAPNGNNAFQLEWTWLDDEMAQVYTENGQVNTDKLFLNNATRVDLASNIFSYSIPNYYESSGKLYYRIRAVNKNETARTDGLWVVASPVTTTGHNTNLNWQVRTSFAEEGKRKTVMEYFDGSLRSRQTVTKDNSTNTTVVSETFYDGQGRPAVQILPSPTLSNIISYQANLNLFNSSDANQANTSSTANINPAFFFDLQPSIPVVTSDHPQGLSNISGSSLYYSSANTDKNNGFNKFIPDAQDYPYTLTRYTPDGSGRIMKQSGVGYKTRIGSGKETKYFYGTPSQEDLDALFGTEAGYFSHYFKNMVQDANGQMSVSYVDMHGRTVATALAGEAPANLNALYPAATYPVVTRNLLGKGANLVINNQNIESVNTLLVPAATSYSFAYTLTPDKLTVPGCSTTVCYNCLYNLEISVTDESGESLPIVRRFNNLSVVPLYDCGTAPFLQAEAGNPLSVVSNNQVSFNEILQPGSYSVRKTLTLSEASLQIFKDEYISKALCKTKQEIIDSVYLELKNLNHCDQPETSVPDNSNHLLETKRLLMLQDMMPFSGQYAQNPEDISTLLANSDAFKKYNIFSSAGYSNQPYYRHPTSEYLDDNSIRDETIYDDESLLPNATPQDFQQLFKSKWAESLIGHHPEYDKLIFAESHLASSYTMIDKFSNINTYAEAELAGYIFTSEPSLTNPSTGDPFYSLSSLGTKKSDMVNYITNGYQPFGNGVMVTMWQLARSQVKCTGYSNTADIGACATANNEKVPPFSNITSTEEKDRLWQAFKGLYLNERDEQINNYIQENIPLSSTEANDLINNDFLLRFPTGKSQMSQQLNHHDNGAWNWYPNPGPPQPAPASTQCDSYIQTWKQSLSQCPALKADSNIINEIVNRMNAVCKNGTDAVSPNGSSTVAPNTPANYTDRSFEDVIKNVLASHNIAITDYCNPYVIEYPKPYGKGPKLSSEIITTIDTCNCRQFQQFQSDAYNQTEGTSNTFEGFNYYLHYRGFDTLTRVLYDALLQHCGNMSQYTCTTTTVHQIKYYLCETTPPVCDADASASSSSTTNIALPPDGYCRQDLYCPVTTCTTTYYPFVLSFPQPMPDFLQCGFTDKKSCYSCAELSSLKQEFKNYFPAPYNNALLFSGTNIDGDQIERNKSFARFLNFKTGFYYTWLDYAKHADSASCNLESNTVNNSNATQNVICANTRAVTDTTGIFVLEDKCKHTMNMAIALGEQIYEARVKEMLAAFEAAYRAKCLTVQSIEGFTVTYSNKEYHYTLYYYDAAGNLVKTVPPKAVITNYTTSYQNAVKIYRDANAYNGADYLLTPYSNPSTNINESPALSTNYRYNSLNQVVQQHTPDAGTSEFWYDRLGRLVVSRNAQQNYDGKYSYTQYDALGRIIEVGQKPQSTQMTQDISQGKISSPTLYDWINNSGGTREQLTLTAYDDKFQPLINSGLIDQQNLRNRVSYTATKNLATDNEFYAATYYTYDIHGNVNVLLQDFNGISSMKQIDPSTQIVNRYKKIAYNYDLISGKVNQVNYQPDQPDAFYHRYSYDAENRITNVETSRDNIMWEQDAEYQYYKHGPLARTKLGQLNVQGLDYAYTLQGWLKGVNSTAISAAESAGCTPGTGYDILSLNNRAQYNQPNEYTAKIEIDLLDGFESTTGDAFETFIDPTALPCNSSNIASPYINGDMGEDGKTVGNNPLVARDVFGFSLNYYNNDYIPINSSVAPFATGMHNLPAALDGTGTAAELFNGNIASMMVSNSKLSAAGETNNGSGQMLYGYQYDQLNRIVSMNAYDGFNNQNNTFTPISIEDYKERVTYDPNGNIMSYMRNGTTAGARPLAMDALHYNYIQGTNQLDHVGDDVNGSQSNNYSEDIDEQNAGNYVYDKIGNLIADNTLNKTLSIQWTVYGKIKSITKSTGTITYTYDAAGNRISKTVGGKTTIYVRDATGNVMAVYQSLNNAYPTMEEAHLYGSSRLGIMTPHSEPAASNTVASGYGMAKIATFTRGEKFFELSNHLGNVLATISDKKIGVSSNGTTVDYFNADVITAQDYAPFGSLLPGRQYSQSTSKYRYGFNGKENDNEVKGEGNQQDYGMRIYDPRLGRFLSVDPLQKKYPELTPYQYASNRPIDGIDIDGLEWGTFTYKAYKDAQGSSHITITKEQYDDSWLGSIGGKQLWLRPENSKQGQYGNQGISFGSFREMWDAAAKFGSGQADFDANYEAFNKATWENFEVIALTDLALHAHGAVEGYANNKIAVKTNTPTAATNNQAVRVNGNVEAANANAANEESSIYNRVKPRKSTLQQVEQNQPRNENGQMIDPNTKKPLQQGQIDLGHKPGQEWKKRQAMHMKKGSTRPQVIKEENNPDIYHYEDRSSNRSHKYEKKN